MRLTAFQTAAPSQRGPLSDAPQAARFCAFHFLAFRDGDRLRFELYWSISRWELQVKNVDCHTAGVCLRTDGPQCQGRCHIQQSAPTDSSASPAWVILAALVLGTICGMALRPFI